MWVGVIDYAQAKHLVVWKATQNVDATGVGSRELHGKAIYVHFGEGTHDEVVGSLRVVLSVEVGVADMHADGYAVEAIDDAVY